MDDRLIFLYHQIRVITDGGTREGRSSHHQMCAYKPEGGM